MKCNFEKKSKLDLRVLEMRHFSGFPFLREHDLLNPVMSFSNISAVIFDMDGTLLDSERLSHKAWDADAR